VLLPGKLQPHRLIAILGARFQLDERPGDVHVHRGQILFLAKIEDTVLRNCKKQDLTPEPAPAVGSAHDEFGGPRARGSRTRGRVIVRTIGGPLPPGREIC